MTAKPWFQHFWVWFMLTPVIASVIAGFVTLYLAGAPPSLVVDDFGQIAMAVELDQQRDQRAADLGVAARLKFSARSTGNGQAVTVNLSGAAPEGIRLELIHPTLEQMDRQVILKRSGDLYTGTLSHADTRLHVLISDIAGNWRLTGVLEPRQEVLELKAGP
jgi:hypothetical protein